MLKGPIAVGAIRTSFVLSLRLLVQAGTLLLVARLLGPDEFGAFAGIASLAVLLGTLSTFGTQLVLLSEVSKEPSRRDDVLPYAIPTTLLCGGLLFGIYLAVAYWILPANSMPWLALLAIGFTEVVLQPLFGLMSTEHHALGRVARAQLMQNGPLTLRLLTAAIIFLVDLSPVLSIYAGGYLAASMLVLLFGAYSLPKKWPNWRSWRLPKIAEWRHAFGYAAINISKTGPTELDKTLAMKLLPLEVAGIYAAGTRVVGAISLPVTAMILAALPRLFRYEKVLPGRLLGWMLISALCYGLLVSSILWLTAPFFETAFGDDYHGVEGVIRWLCIAVPGMSLRHVLGNILVTFGKSWTRIVCEAFGLSILVAMGVMLSNKYGLHGMIFSIIFFEWVMVVLFVLCIARIRGRAPSRLG